LGGEADRRDPWCVLALKFPVEAALKRIGDPVGVRRKPRSRPRDRTPLFATGPGVRRLASTGVNRATSALPVIGHRENIRQRGMALADGMA
jgi:hypothetical protein